MLWLEVREGARAGLGSAGCVTLEELFNHSEP